MSETSLAPKIRFKGFADPWEQRKLGELCTISRGLTYSPDDVVDFGRGVRVLRSSNILEDRFELHEDDIFVREGSVNIDYSNDGDILITAANGSTRLVGKRAKIVGLAGKTVHGGFMLRAVSDDPDFLNASMGARWYRRFLEIGVSGGNGSLGNLDLRALSECELTVPSRAERGTIGALFSGLDSLITLHQRKYDKLCAVKKALLEKMFPKEGETVPEIRFKGFADPWEQRKLGEVARISRGERFTASDYVEADGIPCIHYGEIYTHYGPVAHEAISQVRPDMRGSLRFASPGDLIVAATSENVEDVCKAVAWLGNSQVAYHDDSFAISHSSDPVFMSALFGSPLLSRQKPSAAHGVKVMRVSRDSLSCIEVPMPSLPEQARIGALFSRLDSLITLHQRELETLKNVKKSLLEKMFV